jgi:hypothetical protein
LMIKQDITTQVLRGWSEALRVECEQSSVNTQQLVPTR